MASNEPSWLSALLSPAAIAACASAVTALALKGADLLTARHAGDVSEAAQFRDEMRREIERQRAEITRIDAELDAWKGKYYEQLADNLALRAEVAALRAELQRLGRQVNGAGVGAAPSGSTPAPEGA